MGKWVESEFKRKNLSCNFYSLRILIVDTVLKTLNPNYYVILVWYFLLFLILFVYFIIIILLFVLKMLLMVSLNLFHICIRCCVVIIK